ncbi:MAG: hypothetical protein HZA54_18475 [Planctomycetes bacterium]|nr:hypothetical protein [Planctomycetota bacterium]
MFTPRLVETANRAMAEAPRRPEPHFHLGRLYRAQMKFDEAKAEQDQALAKDPDYAPSRYERGVLLVADSRQLRGEKRAELLRLLALEAKGERVVPDAPTDAEVENAYPLVADLKRRALEDLTRATDLGGSQPGMAARARAARGMVAGIEGQPEADRLLSESLTEDSRLEEVYAALAEREAARQEWQEAARRYEEGWKIDLGYSPHIIGLSESLNEVALAAERGGHDGGEFRRRGRRALNEALRRDPGQAELWGALAVVWHDQGDALRARGKDPTAEYQESIGAFDKALAIEPRSFRAANNQGRVYMSLGFAKRDRGEDPGDEYRKALAGYNHALWLDPRSSLTPYNRSIVYHSLGDVKRSRGEDPMDEYRKALAGYDRALAINPRFADAGANQSNVYQSLGDAKAARGEDPTDEYRRALQGYDWVLATNPNLANAACNQANLYQSIGDAKRARGEDSTDEYRKALAGYDRALAINSNLASAANSRANVYQLLGDAKQARSEDPTDEYREALVGYDRALEINPNFAPAAYNQANVFKSLGYARRARGEDPTDHYRKALVGYDRALEMNPNLANAANNQAFVHLSLGHVKRARGEDPTDEYRKALASCDRSIQISPRIWQAHATRGQVLEALAEPSEAVRAYESALAFGRDADAAVKPLLARAVATATVPPAAPPARPPWLAALQRADVPIGAGDYAAARPALEEGLAGFAALSSEDRTQALTQPAVRQALDGARYNLACILALASAGRDRPTPTAGPSAPALPAAAPASAPPPPADAARLRDAAFQHLHAAIDLGYGDAAHLAADSDLAPLHDDPRWKDLINAFQDSSLR